MKKLLFIAILFCSTILSAQMTTAWTSNISASDRPTASTIPSVAALTNPNKEAFLIDLPGTLDNANDSLAFAQIGDAVKMEIDTNWLVQVFAIDTSLDITGRILIRKIERRYDTFTRGDFKNQYKVANDIFRVIGELQWVKNP